jgi:hypothetical protein
MGACVPYIPRTGAHVERLGFCLLVSLCRALLQPRRWQRSHLIWGTKADPCWIEGERDQVRATWVRVLISLEIPSSDWCFSVACGRVFLGWIASVVSQSRISFLLLVFYWSNGIISPCWVDYVCTMLDLLLSQFDSAVRITSYWYLLALSSNHPAVHIHYKIKHWFSISKIILILIVNSIVESNFDI